MEIKVSAPGKLMLFGEHAVVYGIPCITFAVNQRLYCKIKEREDNKIVLNFPDIGIKDYEYQGKTKDKKISFVSATINNILERVKEPKGFSLETKSEMRAGIGTSSASVVATIFALNKFFSLNLKKEDIFNTGYKTVLDVQGTGSGYDIATSTYGGMIKYVKGEKPIQIEYPKNLCLVVGHTKIKADTKKIVEKVAKKKEKYPHFYSDIFDLTKKCVEEAEENLRKGNLKRLADMLNFAHGILNGMGVSHPKLEELIFASRSAGALGAKLSGAGGGDCMIALVTEESKDKVISTIKEHGGIPFEVKIDEGVRIEGGIIEYRD